MNEPIDITNALTKHHAQMGSDRPDDGRLHVADLTKCVREIWARRNGKILYGYDTTTRRRFHQGHQVEAEILEALEVYVDRYEIMRDVLVWLDVVDGELTGGECIGGEGPPYYDTKTLGLIPESAIIGHPDAVMLALAPDPQASKATPDPHVLVEVKSTRFWDNGLRIPDAPQYQYAIQASAYALALGITWAWVIVSCVISLLVTPSKAPFKFDVNKYRVDIIKAILERREATLPGAPEPPAEPPSYTERDRPKPGQSTSWLCQYCAYGACEKNANPEGRSIT